MRKALKRAIAYGIYYIIFIGVTIYGTIRGWPLRIPILLVFLILLYACVGGKSNAITEYRYHTDNPMTELRFSFLSCIFSFASSTGAVFDH